MVEPKTLAARLQDRFADALTSCEVHTNLVSVEVSADALLKISQSLRDDAQFLFSQLTDLAGVDFSEYGNSEWGTEDVTGSGFCRGVESRSKEPAFADRPRFAVVYHLLSVEHNCRLRVRAFAPGDPPALDSVTGIWPAANWYEREAFDLFGIAFRGHPDLRRILTDYGFIGHPFRKDFPVSGNVEMRYDPEQQRVVYEPVSIEPRVLVPRVIREDHRYSGGAGEGEGSDG